MRWLQREIGCAAVAVLACAEERTIAALLALIERAIVHLHADVCGGVRERPLLACSAIDDVAALESADPCKPDIRSSHSQECQTLSNHQPGEGDEQGKKG